ncbi:MULTISPECIES: hypothetical protein [unclassified Variovorax]|jgi:hypothetical protein|uniref:hypothetical protein n=1 Tax=unclassified Variovorax TaxID=663243 RepID=UPI000F7E982E|nr:MULTISPECIES: hypothetical protein [unclassified Variovorax]RSZ45752.1 hypothetical protein EJO70_04635 [Variovorax sp. 553]RSZ46793.1 hypothetical protein EJO71_06675 [Variovorax sp. 679]
MAETSPRQLLIPFAGRGSPSCRAALTTLRLPNLESLLARLTLADTDTQDESTRSPPHERALAQALGIASPDGCIPWAALEARRLGIAAPGDTEGWGLVTLCNWQVGIDDVVLGDPGAIEIDAAESAALLAAARPFFEEDGIALHPSPVPGRWLARAGIFDGLATASIDRAVGYPVSQWSPLADAARPLRRLQNEMQMLLYTQRVNDERAARGVPPINSFWLAGTGALKKEAAEQATAPTVDDTLRIAALRDDGIGWAAAWQALDAGPLAALLAEYTRGSGDVSLTLCGDRASQRYIVQPRGLARWAKSLFDRKQAATVLEAL